MDNQMNAPLGEIAEEIGEFCATWGRIHISQTKEKYDTVRVYCSFGFWGFHTLIWPRYVVKHKNCPSWLYVLDFKLISKNNLINYVLVPYQHFIYRLAYKKAIKKYPEAYEAIIWGADHSELLEGIKE